MSANIQQAKCELSDSLVDFTNHAGRALTAGMHGTLTAGILMLLTAAAALEWLRDEQLEGRRLYQGRRG